MTGTYGSALAARKITTDGKLVGEVRGDVESDPDGVLIVRRIHVEMVLRAPEEKRETAERVLGIYANSCPLYRTTKGCIDLTSSLTFIPEESLRS
jgi:organic hydroperoxide reductase OsmC/OhrA